MSEWDETGTGVMPTVDVGYGQFGRIRFARRRRCFVALKSSIRSHLLDERVVTSLVNNNGLCNIGVDKVLECDVLDGVSALNSDWDNICAL